MYGLKRGDISFEVSLITKRRKPCLTVTHENKIFKVGQFNDMESAEKFFKILDYVCFETGYSDVMKIFSERETDQ